MHSLDKFFSIAINCPKIFLIYKIVLIIFSHICIYERLIKYDSNVKYVPVCHVKQIVLYFKEHLLIEIHTSFKSHKTFTPSFINCDKLNGIWILSQIFLYFFISDILLFYLHDIFSFPFFISASCQSHHDFFFNFFSEWNLFCCKDQLNVSNHWRGFSFLFLLISILFLD